MGKSIVMSAAIGALLLLAGIAHGKPGDKRAFKGKVGSIKLSATSVSVRVGGQRHFLYNSRDCRKNRFIPWREALELFKEAKKEDREIWLQSAEINGRWRGRCLTMVVWEP